jgi:hypothetical protein
MIIYVQQSAQLGGCDSRYTFLRATTIWPLQHCKIVRGQFFVQICLWASNKRAPFQEHLVLIVVKTNKNVPFWLKLTLFASAVSEKKLPPPPLVDTGRGQTTRWWDPIESTAEDILWGAPDAFAEAQLWRIDEDEKAFAGVNAVSVANESKKWRDLWFLLQLR